MPNSDENKENFADRQQRVTSQLEEQQESGNRNPVEEKMLERYFLRIKLENVKLDFDEIKSIAKQRKDRKAIKEKIRNIQEDVGEIKSESLDLKVENAGTASGNGDNNLSYVGNEFGLQSIKSMLDKLIGLPPHVKLAELDKILDKTAKLKAHVKNDEMQDNFDDYIKGMEEFKKEADKIEEEEDAEWEKFKEEEKLEELEEKLEEELEEEQKVEKDKKLLLSNENDIEALSSFKSHKDRQGYLQEDVDQGMDNQNKPANAKANDIEETTKTKREKNPINGVAYNPLPPRPK